MRHGPHVALDEPKYVTWTAIDEVGVYTDGNNREPAVRGPFIRAGRAGRLIDGQRHNVRVVYSGSTLLIYFDGEAEPSFGVQDFHLDQHNAFDANGAAWIGFTASTGIASIDTDLLAFSFCRFPGCDAA